MAITVLDPASSRVSSARIMVLSGDSRKAKRVVLILFIMALSVDIVTLSFIHKATFPTSSFFDRLDDVFLMSLCATTLSGILLSLCSAWRWAALLSGFGALYDACKAIAAGVLGIGGGADAPLNAVSLWLSTILVTLLSVGQCLWCVAWALKTHNDKRLPSRSSETSLYELLEEDIDEEPDQKPRLSWRGVTILLRPYFWPNSWKGRVAVASTLCLVFFSKACTIAAPLLLGTAANAVAKGEASRGALYGVGYATLSLGAKVFKEGQSLAYLRVQRVAFAELARHTFAHLHSLSLQWYLSNKMGQIVRVVDRGTSGADTMMRYGVLYLGPSIGEAIAVCAIFIVKFELWQLSVLVAGCVGAYAGATVVLTLWRAKFRAKMNVSDNKWHTKLTDSLVNFETVKFFTAEAYELRSFGMTVASYQRSSVSVQASLSLLNIVQQLILNACLAGSLAIAASKAQSVGAFISVSSYVTQLFTPLSFLGTVYNALITAIVDLRNLSQLLAEPPLVRDSADAIAHPNVSHGGSHGLDVAFRDVRFKYPERRATFGLQNVSFEVPAGSSLGICGHTGSGKSTCARLIFRFYDVDAGAISIGGIDIRKCTQASIRSLLGVVPQDTVLFNDTIAYNIAYGHPDTRGLLHPSSPVPAGIQEAAMRAELGPLLASLDDGLHTLVGERGLQLSGGEKQRVAIARLMLKNAPIAIFDEATSALDSTTERSIQDSLNLLSRDRTTITIAHRLGSIRNCDQILVLGHGAVIEVGTHHYLLNSLPDSRYAQMWKAQVATDLQLASDTGQLASG